MQLKTFYVEFRFEFDIKIRGAPDIISGRISGPDSEIIELSGIRSDIRAGYFSNIRQIRYPVGYEKALSGAPLIKIKPMENKIIYLLYIFKN